MTLLHSKNSRRFARPVPERRQFESARVLHFWVGSQTVRRIPVAYVFSGSDSHPSLQGARKSGFDSQLLNSVKARPRELVQRRIRRSSNG